MYLVSFAYLFGVVLHSAEPRFHDEFPLRLVEGVLLELEEVRAARGLELRDARAGGVDQHLGRKSTHLKIVVLNSSSRNLAFIF